MTPDGARPARSASERAERGHRLSARHAGRGDAARRRAVARRRPRPARARASPPIERGDRDRAGELALAAYLDGFEPVEAMLNARDAGIVARVERASGEFRAAIHDGAPVAEVAAPRRRSSRPVRRGRAGAGARGGRRHLDLPRRLRHPAARGAGGAADRRRDDHLPDPRPSGATCCAGSMPAGRARWRPGSRPGGRRPI